MKRFLASSVLLAALAGSATFAVASTSSAATTTKITVKATEQASAVGNKFGTLYIQDDELFTGKMTGASYTAHDGYKKIVLGLNTHVAAVDIANCGHNKYAENPTGGTGLPCHPRLHTQEVFYSPSGTLDGRGYEQYHHFRSVTVKERVEGSGQYLTVGAIDHGAMIQITYDTPGQHLTVNLKGDVLINRVVIEPETGLGYTATVS